MSDIILIIMLIIIGFSVWFIDSKPVALALIFGIWYVGSCLLDNLE